MIGDDNDASSKALAERKNDNDASSKALAERKNFSFSWAAWCPETLPQIPEDDLVAELSVLRSTKGHLCAGAEIGVLQAAYQVLEYQSSKPRVDPCLLLFHKCCLSL